MQRTVVVALGGNALVEPGQAGTHLEQGANARAMAIRSPRLTAAGRWRGRRARQRPAGRQPLAIQQHVAAGTCPPPLFSPGRDDAGPDRQLS